MKITSITLALFALAAFLPAAGPDIVAKVNGTEITKQNLELQKLWLAENLKRMGREVKEEDRPQLEKQALDSLIEMELLVQEANRQGIAVKPEEAAARFEEFRGNFPKPEDFAQFLKSMNTTETKMRQDIEREILANALMEKWFATMPAVTDARVAEYYGEHPEQFQAPERVQASHILVKVDEGADPGVKAAARKKIEEIQAKLKAGGDFAALAKEHSDCPSKERGGDLGFFTKGQMVPEFEAAAFALKPGEVSGIVETKFGFHIIKGTEHAMAGATPLPEVKDRLQTFLENGEKRELLQKKIAELRKVSKIEMTAVSTPAPKTSAKP